MARAAGVVGTHLLDHVIVTRDASASMLDRHLVLAFDSSVQPSKGQNLKSAPLRGDR
jgi:hypothetical protein